MLAVVVNHVVLDFVRVEKADLAVRALMDVLGEICHTVIERLLLRLG